MKHPQIPTHYRQYRVEGLHFWDIRQIAQLERLVFLEPMSVSQVCRKYFLSRTRYLVVKDQGRIIAYFGFEVLGQYAHVLANVTHPQYRRQGLAAFVLTRAQPWAERLGAKAFLGEVRLSNQAQLEVLEMIGWKQLGIIPRFFGNGEDAHIVMKVF